MGKVKYTMEHELWLLKNHNNENSSSVHERMRKVFPNDDIKYDWVKTTLDKNGLGKSLSYKTAEMEKFVKAVWDPNIMSLERCAKMCSDYFGTPLTRPGLAYMLKNLGLPLESTKYSKADKMNTIFRRGYYLSRIDFRSYTKEQQELIRKKASSEYTIWYIPRALKTLLDNNIKVTEDNIIEHLNGDSADDRLENLEVVSNQKVQLAAHCLLGGRGGTTNKQLHPELVRTAIAVTEALKVRDKRQ